ncbi:C-reactive protein-like [Protopterus annectens]|uniref:C-reactive protein-like n=1 Tax=Protopterus annectens TaxID=7888 RepID=UPI001CFAE1ED|nr:C-reactive protein-like [Protopterus annectens]XP_043944532.1 C-reactive protein-like [Protopterus annectens]
MSVTFLLILLAGSAFLTRNANGSPHYNFIFPLESSTANVKLTPKKVMNFSAFTLCVRAFTELNREYSLFSYATSARTNELLLLSKSKETFEMFIGDRSVTITAKNVHQTWNHVCVTWNSNTGLVGLWMNGVRSVRKSLAKGHTIALGGVVIIGQDQDILEGGFDASQSFVGELNSVNLWDYLLSPQEIHDAREMKYSAVGNVIDMGTIKYCLTGDVVVEEITEPCNINVTC